MLLRDMAHLAPYWSTYNQPLLGLVRIGNLQTLCNLRVVTDFRPSCDWTLNIYILGLYLDLYCQSVCGILVLCLFPYCQTLMAILHNTHNARQTSRCQFKSSLLPRVSIINRGQSPILPHTMGCIWPSPQCH